MKYRNILALVAALVFFAAGQVVSAQTQPDDSSNSGTQGAQDQGRRLGRSRGFRRPNLNLTADQKAKLKAIHESTRQQIAALRNDSTLSQTDKQAKFRAIHENSRQQLQALLTPEQQQSLHNVRRERSAFAHGRFLGELGLTADQKSQMQTIQQSNRAQVTAVRNDSTLSQEQRQAKIKSILQSSHQQVLNVLTPDQQQKLRDHRGGRFGHRGRRGGFGSSKTSTGGSEQ